MKDIAPIPLNKSKMKMTSAFEELAKSEKLIRVLGSRNQRCPTCIKPEFTDHLHFIVDEGCTINPVEGLPELVDVTCSCCAQPANQGFKICSKCRLTFYCNKSCQKTHWAQHSKECSSKSKPLENGTCNSPSAIVNGSEPLDQIKSVKEMPSVSQNAVGKNVSSLAVSRQSNAVPKVVEKSKGDLERIANDEVDEAVKVPPRFSITPKVMSKPAVPESSVVDIKKMDLKINSTFKCVLTYGSSPASFYVQRVSDAETATFITTCLNDECPKMSSWDDVKQLKIGQYCAGLFASDGFWYRAKLVHKSEQSYTIKFIDFGNVEVVDECNLRPLPASMCEKPALAIPCKLFDIKPAEGTWSEAAILQFAKYTDSEKFDVCKVFGRDKDDVYLVDLSAEDGTSVVKLMLKANIAVPISAKKVETPSTEMASKCPEKTTVSKSPEKSKAVPKAPSPIAADTIIATPNNTSTPKNKSPSAGLSSKPSMKSLRSFLRKPAESEVKIASFLDSWEVGKSVKAIITSVQDAKQFKYCLMLNVDLFCEIATNVSDYCKDGNQLSVISDVSVGTIGLSRGEDMEWNRSLVLKVTDNGQSIVCLFIDLGIVESVKKIYSMPAKLTSAPSLFGLTTAIGETSKNVLKGVSFNEPVPVTVVASNVTAGEVLARIKLDAGGAVCNVSIKSYLNATKEMLESFERPVEPEDAAAVVPVVSTLVELEGDEHSLVVVYCEPEDPATFYVIADPDVMGDIMHNMPEIISVGKPIAKPMVGMYCLANCSEDLEWYRARITEVDKDHYVVYYVDFGNYDSVSIDKLKTLSDAFSPDKSPEKKSQAVKCVLTEKSRTSGNFAAIKKSLDGELLTFKIVSKQNDHYVVSI